MKNNNYYFFLNPHLLRGKKDANWNSSCPWNWNLELTFLKVEINIISAPLAKINSGEFEKCRQIFPSAKHTKKCEGLAAYLKSFFFFVSDCLLKSFSSLVLQISQKLLRWVVLTPFFSLQKRNIVSRGWPQIILESSCRLLFTTRCLSLAGFPSSCFHERMGGGWC